MAPTLRFAKERTIDLGNRCVGVEQFYTQKSQPKITSEMGQNHSTSHHTCCLSCFEESLIQTPLPVPQPAAL